MTQLDAEGRRWVAWRNERRGDKLTKIPYWSPDRKPELTIPQPGSVAPKPNELPRR